MGTAAKNKRGSVMIKLHGQRVAKLRGARVVGPVSVHKHTDGGHVKVEIRGIEIDGFGDKALTPQKESA